jgi:predicted O-methyltransferase YrrM
MTTTSAPPMLQNHVEFQQLLDLYTTRRPERVLEVGADQGGTLYRWLEHAAAGARIVALDDRHLNRAAYPDWIPDGVELTTITGSSHDPDVLIDVASHRPYDFVFIDADHHDHAVRADWRHFSAMAAADAVVAFHDIAPSSDPTIHVDELWFELAHEHEHAEFCVPGGPGIGVVFLREMAPVFRHGTAR